MDPERVHDPAAPPPLIRRDPRSFAVHAAVDAAVAFLLSAVVLLIWDVDIITVVVIAAVLGLIAAPLTRRAEARGLAARPDADPQRPDGPRASTN
jgi:hypothetical protein